MTIDSMEVTLSDNERKVLADDAVVYATDADVIDDDEEVYSNFTFTERFDNFDVTVKCKAKYTVTRSVGASHMGMSENITEYKPVSIDVDSVDVYFDDGTCEHAAECFEESAVQKYVNECIANL